MSANLSVLTHRQLLSDKVRPLGWSRPESGLFRLWMTRIRDRRQLRQFDSRDLRDMRISQWDAQHELAKHFWQA